VERADKGGLEQRLYEIVLGYLEAAECGETADPAELQGSHPEFAAELEAFLDTWAAVERLTEPIRSASRMLGSAVENAPPPRDAGGGNGRPERAAGEQPVAADADGGGWLGRWLRQHPPLAPAQYPFLHAAGPAAEIGRLGSYRLLEVIGNGGMGVVFRAEDEALRRPAAVKVMRAELAADPGSRARFLREARAAAALNHEHVVTVYQVGEEGGIPFLVMQWLRGFSLDELLRRTGILQVRVVLRFGRQIALGLAAAHARGLLHRDIKPANLWVEWPEDLAVRPDARPEALTAARIKILDFGLARCDAEEGQITCSGAAVGTPAYMASEQAAGLPVDARSDLFALGVVLYRMCTGRLPFVGRPGATGAGAPPSDKAPPVTVLNPAAPSGLSELVGELLAPEPAGRPASAAEVAARLEALQEPRVTPAGPTRPVVAPPAPALPRPAKSRMRRWLTCGVVAVAVLVPLAYLFGSAVVRFGTNRGEVVIVVDDPGMEVTVKEGGAVIVDPAGRRRITLASGAHDLDVTVRDPGGETRFFSKSIVLNRGGKQVLNVREELARDHEATRATRDGGPSETATVDAPERRPAERLFAFGAILRVADARGDRIVQTAGQLPADRFRVVEVYLNNTRVDDAGLAYVAQLPSLALLDLVNTEVTDAGLGQLTGLKNLRQLRLAGTKVTDAGLTDISRIPSLVSVDLTQTRVGDARLATLAAMKNIQALALARTRVTDAGLAHLRGREDLRTLDLRDTPVTDAGLAHLAPLAKLEMLDVDGTRVTDAGLAHLAALQRLEYLGLSGLRITDSGLDHLHALAGLRRLNLAGTAVSDAGLARLERIRSLASVDLKQTQVGDAGLATLATMKNLHGLVVGRTRVTDAGLAALRGREDLVSLDLGGTAVTDAGLASLDGLTGLLSLSLSDTRVTDAGLAHLAAMKQLRKLALAGTAVSDNGLAHLFNPPLPPLTEIDLSGSRVSAAGAAAVAGILPRAQLRWWEPNRRAAEAVLAAGGSVRVREAAQGADVAVKTIAALPGSYFRLTGAALTSGQRPSPDLMRALASLTNPEFDDFQELDLSGSSLTDDGLDSLAAAPCRRLVLDGNPLSGPGLVRLKDLSRLRDLSLKCPTLSFLGVRWVGELKRLERLSLADTGATDASLTALRELTGLRELDLTGTKVTAEGAAALKVALPGCTVKVGSAGRR
jgi:serine/threonine protein kinase